MKVEFWYIFGLCQIDKSFDIEMIIYCEMVVDYLEWCDLMYMLHKQLSFSVWISCCDVLDVVQIFGRCYMVSIHGRAYTRY